MTSLVEVQSNEGESILPEVEELEFHPDQLSSIVDIQDELAKLEGRQDVEDVEMSTMDDVNVVDHEVTIIAEQENEEMSILPDITEMDHHSEIVPENEVTSIADSAVNSNVEESLDIGETITIGIPNANASKVINQIRGIADIPKLVPIKPAGHMPLQFAPGVSHLKAIRPLPEGLRGKKPYMTMTQPKKNLLTKVIFSQNNQMTSDSPIIFGEAGQAIRIVGAQNKTVTANSPKTITLAQAREMGLLSPGKVILPNQSKGVVKKGVMMSGNTVTMLKSSPTKILPLPTSGQLHSISSTQGISGPPQKIFIRQSPAGLKAGTFTGTILASSSGTQGQFLQIPVSQDGANQIHQIQLPGKQVQYVRLVNSSSAGSGMSDTVVTARQPVPVALTSVSTVPQFKMMPITSAHTSAATPQVQVQAQAGSSFERVLVSPGLSQLAARSEGKPTNNVVMVPAEFVKQYTPPTTVSMPSPPSPPMLTVHAPVVSTPAPSPSPTMSLPLPPPPPLTKAKEMMPTTPIPPPPPPRKSSAEPPNGIRPRKPCNCTKSQCLKLYCDCFANGEFCFQCNCNCCYNNLDHEEERQRAIKACLERNPNAFRPKIGKGYIGDERRHNKGCNCKRSGCLKNYCECYEAKIPCSNNCKCVGCRNVEEAKHIHDRTSGDGGFQTNKLNKLLSDVQETSLKPNSFPPSQGNRQPFNLMTQEVVEATCQCLLGQVEGDEVFTDHVERLIIQEFGRCLVEIIQCATRTTSAVNTNPT